ncbi:hypothetical protein B0O99DRAFT_600751 [Bisporella sp. PMI_857]|nr:hypothetical protein B0O99DRAFT_600751 [Bisporella sp. PMI_857]
MYTETREQAASVGKISGVQQKDPVPSSPSASNRSLPRKPRPATVEDEEDVLKNEIDKDDLGSSIGQPGRKESLVENQIETTGLQSRQRTKSRIISRKSLIELQLVQNHLKERRGFVRETTSSFAKSPAVFYIAPDGSRRIAHRPSWKTISKSSSGSSERARGKRRAINNVDRHTVKLDDASNHNTKRENLDKVKLRDKSLISEKIREKMPGKESNTAIKQGVPSERANSRHFTTENVAGVDGSAPSKPAEKQPIRRPFPECPNQEPLDQTIYPHYPFFELYFESQYITALTVHHRDGRTTDIMPSCEEVYVDSNGHYQLCPSVLYDYIPYLEPPSGASSPQPYGVGEPEGGIHPTCTVQPRQDVGGEREIQDPVVDASSMLHSNGKGTGVQKVDDTSTGEPQTKDADSIFTKTTADGSPKSNGLSEEQGSVPYGYGGLGEGEKPKGWVGRFLRRCHGE